MNPFHDQAVFMKACDQTVGEVNYSQKMPDDDVVDVEAGELVELAAGVAGQRAVGFAWES